MEARLFQRGDEARILPVIRDFFNYQARLHGELADCTLDDARAILRTWLNAADAYRMYVLVVGDEIVAFARVRVDQNVHYLEAFGVAEQQRARGYGTALLRFVEDDLRQRGATALHVPTYVGNLPGLDFLLKNGYSYLHTIELQKVFGPVDERAELDLFGRKLKLL